MAKKSGKSNRGFASMDKGQQREIARKGGESSGGKRSSGGSSGSRSKSGSQGRGGGRGGSR